MKVKITIEHDNKTFEGIMEVPIVINKSSSSKMLEKATNPYRKDSTLYYLFKLITEDKFFTNYIKTTQEVVDKLWTKFRKKILMTNAVRDFQKIVEDGYLEKEFISPTNNLPKGAYIWFLPSTSKEEIENFIKNIKEKKNE
jgi:hypothetical protein